MFFTFVDLFNTDRAGLGGLCVVLTAGLAAMMIGVRVPREAN
jgi:UMF1 family MFS transporter